MDEGFPYKKVRDLQQILTTLKIVKNSYHEVYISYINRIIDIYTALFWGVWSGSDTFF